MDGLSGARVFAAALCILLGALIGYRKSQRVARRAAVLGQLARGLDLLGQQIDCAALEPPAALESTGRILSGEAGSWFSQLGARARQSALAMADLWEQAMELPPVADLPAGDREPLMHLGPAWAMRRVELVERLSGAKGQLSTLAESARQDQQKKGRMWQSVGLLIGLMAAVLLL